MVFARFMATPTGRILRIVVGIVIIWLGIAVVDKPLGYVVEVIGLVPIIAGIMNICFVGRLLGAPLKASDLD